jgi:hypothetical protein
MMDLGGGRVSGIHDDSEDIGITGNDIKRRFVELTRL